VSRPLRFALVGLVLTNLGFAYITEAANWNWLLPMVVLTLAAPWLARFSGYLAYRGAWNVAVIAAFGLMIHHVTSRDGVEHLLEDGLMLAALCQVHLLNNLGRMQKPDLLFFNSFLIALVTSYLSVDVGYSVVFLLYAPLLVFALQLMALERSGAILPTGHARRLLLAGAGRAVVVVGLTLAVFVLVPRDFTRKGYFGDKVNLSNPGGLARIDFSKSVHLDKLGGARASNRVILRVHLERGARHAVPQHWRGATLDEFDGARWKPARQTRVLAPVRWRRVGRDETHWVRGRGEAVAQVTVERVGSTEDRLPLPLSTLDVRLGANGAGARLRPSGDLTLRAAGEVPRGYRLAIGREGAFSGNSRDARAGTRLWTHLFVSPEAVPDAARALGQEMRGDLPRGGDPAPIVERLRQALSARFAYLPPGTDGGAATLGDFLTTARGGHCEYFASAMVVILRTQGIPCRLVTGFRSDEWDETTNVLTIRSRHAHAWVEVFDPKRGWWTTDPTPASTTDEVIAGLGLWARMEYQLSSLWDRIVGFNGSAAQDVRASLAALPGKLRSNPFKVALALALLVTVVVLRRRRHGLPPDVRGYARTLRRLGLSLDPGETPRELVERAALDEPRLALLAEATREHESRRYAS